MMTHIERMLSKLFPVKLPNGNWFTRLFMPDLQPMESSRILPSPWFTEQHDLTQVTCGSARPKKYRDAIERHWAEEAEREIMEGEVFEKFATTSGRFNF